MVKITQRRHAVSCLDFGLPQHQQQQSVNPKFVGVGYMEPNMKLLSTACIHISILAEPNIQPSNLFAIILVRHGFIAEAYSKSV